MIYPVGSRGGAKLRFGGSDLVPFRAKEAEEESRVFL